MTPDKYNDCAVIFDLDGTLIDSARDIHLGLCDVLRAEGLPETTYEESRSFIGKGVPALIEQALAAKNASDPSRASRMVARFHDIYETAVQETVLYPGVQKSLDAFSEMGMPMGLCTNKPKAPTLSVLAHFGLDATFSAHSFGDGPYPRKPDPAPLRHVIASMGARKILYVGDSETDASTAENAGVPIALYTQGYRKTPIDQIPHFKEFDHFDELTEIASDFFG